MSENQSGYNPFNNAGEKPKVDAYQWGFNFKSIKGANTDMTYGWKGSGVFGLSTSVYVSPVALLPIVGGGVAAGAYVGAVAANDPEAGMAYGTAAVTAPFVTAALANMIFPTAWAYKKLVTATNFLYPGSMVSNHNLSARFPHFMNIPAYMTCEMGAKTDFIFGNKFDYCTGQVNKTVNGETVECYGDKVEWYYANLYKYIVGTELKMEVKDKDLKVDPTFISSTLTRVEVLNDKKHYAENYAAFNTYADITATKDIKHAAGGDLKQTAAANYTLGAKSIVLTAGDSDITSSAMKGLTMTAGTDIFLGSGAGSITMQCGPKKAIVVTAGGTQINNQLSLGMPGVGAVPNVAAAMAAYNQQIAALQADVQASQASIKSLNLQTDILFGLD